MTAVGRGRAPLPDEGVEPVPVEVLVAGPRLISRRPGHDDLVTDRPAQCGHVRLHQRAGGAGRVVVPQDVDDAVGRDGPARFQQQGGEQGADLGATEVHRLVAAYGLDRSE